MLNVKRITIIAVSLLLIGLIGSLVTYQFQVEAETMEETKTFHESITDIIVETDHAKIEILPAASNETKVEWMRSENEKNRYRFEADVENGTLEVRLKEKRLKFFTIDLMKKSVVVKVYLPEKDYNSLDVKTENGKVMIDDISADVVSAESVNGEISLQQIDSRTAEVKSVNGKIHAENLDGEFLAKVTNGTIHLKTVRLDQTVDLESVNGKITVQVDEEPENAEIIVEVVNGSIDIFGRNNQHTVFGDGKNQVKIKTVNGKINVGY